MANYTFMMIIIHVTMCANAVISYREMTRLLAEQRNILETFQITYSVLIKIWNIPFIHFLNIFGFQDDTWLNSIGRFLGI